VQQDSKNTLVYYKILRTWSQVAGATVRRHLHFFTSATTRHHKLTRLS